MESSNINAEDIDQDVGKRLRGDAVGDTMYSASFITKTLLQLSEVNWSTQLEEDLCFLWDMTVEKDVCEYLLELSYPNITCELLKQKQENRLIEILIGILANIFSVIQDKKMTEEDTNTVLCYLSSDDSLILIQVMRFLKAVAYQSQEMLFVNRDTIDQISFILRSSTNIELLTSTLDTLGKLTSDCKTDGHLLHSDIISDIMTALGEIKEKNDLGNSEVRVAYVHAMQIICNLCAYTQTAETFDLDEMKHRSHIFVSEFSQILKYFSEEENLLPVPKELNFYIEALTYIFDVLKVRTYLNIFNSVCKMTIILLKEKYEDVGLYLQLVHLMVLLGDLNSLQDSARDICLESMQYLLKNVKSVNEKCINNKIREIEKVCKRKHKS